MIHREFKNLKFRRTFIGGSKQEELKRFIEVQGTKEDNSECNWVEYRRMLKEYCDDRLNILLTWIYVAKNLRVVLIGIGLLASVFSLGTGLIILALAAASHAVHWQLKCLEVSRLSDYNFSLDIINQETGLTLAKNSSLKILITVAKT